MTHRIIGADDVTGLLPDVVESHIVDDLLTPPLDAETSARITGDATNAASINAEATTRANADTVLTGQISAEATTRGNTDTTLQANIDAETASRISGDATNAAAISAETTARGAADTTLQNNITAEAATRAGADTTLQTNINTVQTNLTAEAGTRASADTANATAIADHIADTTDAHAASAITNTPAGGVAAVTVQAAINELDTEKATLASPVFTGDPQVPTPAVTDVDTSVASTAFALPRPGVTAVKTSAYAAVVGDYVRVDTTSGAVTVTLPSAPATKSVIWVAGVAGNSTLTVARGGTDTFGPTGATSLTLGVGAENPVVAFMYLSGVWHPIWTRSELLAGDQNAVLATSVGAGAINLAGFTAGQYGGYRLTLTGNATFTATAKPLVSAGREYEFWIECVQGGAGSFTLTLNANILKPAGMTVTLSTAVGAIDLLKFKWTGTELLLTEFLKGFA